MHAFAYIAKTSFRLPSNIIDQILKIDPISFDPTDTKSRTPIYRQLNKMVIDNLKISSPINLHDFDRNETLLITQELLDKLQERYQIIRKNWNISYSPFKEQEVPHTIQKQIIACLPHELQSHNPCVVIQSKFEQNGIVPPHKDHYRSASLFFLITGNQEETIWWEKIANFEEYSFFRFADVTKIKKAHTEILEEKCWYVFDQASWHSVHPGALIGRRTAICIEFNNLDAGKLYSCINKNAN